MENILKYDFQLSASRPFLYDFQEYEESFRSVEYDMHEALHLMTILTGVFTVHISGTLLRFFPGDAVLVAPWEIHGNFSVTAHTRLLSIIAAPDLLRIGLSAAGDRFDAFLLLDPASRMKVLAASRGGALCCAHARNVLETGLPGLALHRVSGNRRPDDPLERAEHFLAIQRLMLELLATPGIAAPPADKAALSGRVRPALELLNSGRAVPLTAARAALECRLSRGYFDTLFRKLYGISFYAYELRYRLKRAAEELRAGSGSVKELAARWGFADAAHFSRTFKRFFGIAPSRAFHEHGEAGKH